MRRDAKKYVNKNARQRRPAFFDAENFIESEVFKTKNRIDSS